MTIKAFGAAVGIAALVTFPLTACGSSTPTVTTVTATPTTALSLAPCPPVNDPAWESCVDAHRAQRERDAAERQKQAAVKPTPQGHGIPWWVWLVGTIAAIGGLLWWGTTLDGGSSARTARDDDDDDDWDDDEDDDDVLTYPSIPTTPVAEPIPYPEPPSVHGQPASSGSLMDMLGGK